MRSTADILRSFVILIWRSHLIISNKTYLHYQVFRVDAFAFLSTYSSTICSCCGLNGEATLAGGFGCLTWPLFDAPWCIGGWGVWGGGRCLYLSRSINECRGKAGRIPQNAPGAHKLSRKHIKRQDLSFTN